jgi:2-polyprenyl-3-methyl-5-hydroxy-6-metoxy-1,4-benzoquinol methylase
LLHFSKHQILCLAMDKLFRDEEGNVKQMLTDVEGITFRESPLDFFVLLARYKFAIRFLKKTDHVLDVGCGHGNGTSFLSKFAGKVTGADIDRQLVEHNRQQIVQDNVDFAELDLLNVSQHQKQYDAVISMDVIEHFTKEQTEIVAQSYSDLTKDSGFALIGTPNKASQQYASKRRLQTHLHEFDPDEYEELLSKYFKRVFLFSMTDEVVSTSFPKLSWFLMALCVK